MNVEFNPQCHNISNSSIRDRETDMVQLHHLASTVAIAATATEDEDGNEEEEEEEEEEGFIDLENNYQNAVDCLVRCELVMRSLQDQLAEKDERISSLEETIDRMSLQEAVGAREEDIEVLQHQLAIDNGQIIERDARIASLEERLVRMSLELASAKEMQDTQSQQLNSYKRRISNMSSSISSSDISAREIYEQALLQQLIPCSQEDEGPPPQQSHNINQPSAVQDYTPAKIRRSSIIIASHNDVCPDATTNRSRKSALHSASHRPKLARSAIVISTPREKTPQCGHGKNAPRPKLASSWSGPRDEMAYIDSMATEFYTWPTNNTSSTDSIANVPSLSTAGVECIPRKKSWSESFKAEEPQRGNRLSRLAKSLSWGIDNSDNSDIPILDCGSKSISNGNIKESMIHSASNQGSNAVENKQFTPITTKHHNADSSASAALKRYQPVSSRQKAMQDSHQSPSSRRLTGIGQFLGLNNVDKGCKIDATRDLNKQRVINDDHRRYFERHFAQQGEVVPTTRKYALKKNKVTTNAREEKHGTVDDTLLQQISTDSSRSLLSRVVFPRTSDDCLLGCIDVNSEQGGGNKDIHDDIVNEVWPNFR